MLSLCCLWTDRSAAAGKDDLSPVLLEATQAYTSGRFEEALDKYRQIEAAGAGSGALYYNIGNTYIRLGRPGRALVQYRKAELRMPRDEDLHANIQYALSQVRDRIECRGYASTLRDVCFWYSLMTLSELAWAALALNALFWLLLTLRFFLRREGLAIVLGIVLLLAVLFGTSAAVKHCRAVWAPRGVVVAAEVQVRSGTSRSDTVLFKLHEGAECVCGEDREGWLRISLCDGKKGWVRSDAIERID